MKVALLTNKFDLGGVTNVMRDLARSLPTECDVTMASLMPADGDNLILQEFPSAAVGLASAVRACRNSDVIHSHQRLPALFAGILAPGAKRVEHIHNLFANHKVISFRTRNLVAVSEEIAETTIASFRHVNTVTVIPNGVPDMLDNVPGARPQAALSLVGVGRMTEQKDPLRLLDLTANLRGLDASTNSTWIGSGELSAEYDRETLRKGLETCAHRIDWLERGEIAHKLSRAKFLVITSAWEGLPLVALEAMSLGLPILTTECGAISRVVEDHEIGIVWNDGESAESFALRVSSIGTDDWIAYSERARALYESQYSIQTMAERIFGIYDA